MKELFPGYYRKTEEELKRMWETGIIMFDANVLLNLYRYSESTQSSILELIKRFSGQIYLPHQAALEFNRNRYEVIAEQENAYKEFMKKIVQIQEDLQSNSKPPFLSSNVDQELNEVFSKVTIEVETSINKYSNYLKDDPIYNSISELFLDCITENFSEDELKEIYKEGEGRYAKKNPPGFEDEKTKEGPRKFGDLVLWKQVIRKAKELKKDIILITDERKVDWWWKLKDKKVIGPRPELVEEIKAEAGVDFHMYSSERFLTHGLSFFNERINQRAFEEIQALKKSEIESFRRIHSFFRRKQDQLGNHELNSLYSKLNDVEQQISEIRQDRMNLSKSNLSSIDLDEISSSLDKLEVELEGQKVDLMKRINKVDTSLWSNSKGEYLDELIYNVAKNKINHIGNYDVNY